MKKLTFWRVALLIAVPLVILLVSLFIGRYPKPFWMPPELLSSDALARSLVLNLRLPRLISAFTLGMSLAAAGAVMQMLFRNPLVEPGFLGVTQGAAFGAGLAILLVGSLPFAIGTSATIFAFAGLAFSYLLARRLHYRRLGSAARPGRYRRLSSVLFRCGCHQVSGRSDSPAA